MEWESPPKILRGFSTMDLPHAKRAMDLACIAAPWPLKNWEVPWLPIVMGWARAPHSHSNCLNEGRPPAPIHVSIPMSNPDQQQNRRILIIDDNPAIHEDFRKIL